MRGLHSTHYLLTRWRWRRPSGGGRIIDAGGRVVVASVDRLSVWAMGTKSLKTKLNEVLWVMECSKRGPTVGQEKEEVRPL